MVADNCDGMRRLEVFFPGQFIAWIKKHTFTQMGRQAELSTKALSNLDRKLSCPEH
jgi:hypothetical protein